MAADDVTHNPVPEIVVNRDGPEHWRVAVVVVNAEQAR
jgi:hypothetical protein